MFDHHASRRSVMQGALAGACALSLSARATAAKEASGKHMVLLGDSIFANGAYVGSGPDVIEQLGKRLPLGARATLSAMDGSVTSVSGSKLQIAPEDATHFVVSAGGNDALRHAGLLGEKVSSVAEALDRLATVREAFARDYRTMLDDVTARGLPVAVCTIYDARFPDAQQRPRSGLPSLTTASRVRPRCGDLR